MIDLKVEFGWRIAELVHWALLAISPKSEVIDTGSIVHSLHL
jgi:hypothetical protein